MAETLLPTLFLKLSPCVSVRPVRARGTWCWLCRVLLPCSLFSVCVLALVRVSAPCPPAACNVAFVGKILCPAAIGRLSPQHIRNVKPDRRAREGGVDSPAIFSCSTCKTYPREWSRDALQPDGRKTQRERDRHLSISLPLRLSFFAINPPWSCTQDGPPHEVAQAHARGSI